MRWTGFPYYNHTCDGVGSRQLGEFLVESTERSTLERVIQGANIARKYIQFYPPNNPTVIQSLDHFAAALKAAFKFARILPLPEEALPEGEDAEEEELSSKPSLRGISIDLDKAGFSAESERLCPGDDRIQKFAQELYRLGIRVVHFATGISVDELRRGLEVTFLPPQAVAAEGGLEVILEGRDIRHLLFETAETRAVVDREGREGDIDFVEYLRRRQALRGLPTDEGGDTLPEDSDDLADIAHFFAQVAKGVEEECSYLLNTLRDPDKLAEALTIIAETDAPYLSYGERQVSLEVLRDALKNMCNVLLALPDEKRIDVVNNMAQALDTTEGSVRERVIQQGFAPHIGKDSVENRVLAQLPDDCIADAMSNHVRLHEGTANAVENFVEEFMEDEERRQSIRASVTELLAQEDNQRIQEVVHLLETTSEVHQNAPAAKITKQDVAIDHDERAAIMRELRVEPKEAAAIAAASEEDYETKVEDHSTRTLLELFIFEPVWPISELTKRKFIYLIMEAVRKKNYAFVAELIELMIEEMPAEVRAQASSTIRTILDELCRQSHVFGIVEQLTSLKEKKDDYHHLVYLLTVMGQAASTTLFSRLEMEKNRATRLFLVNLLAEMGESIVVFLHEKTTHKSWYVVRNVLHILGKIGSESAVDAIALTLRHKDMRVRREALSALASIRGMYAEDFIMQCLSDEEPVFRRLAAEWLGHMKATRALPLFVELLTDRGKDLRQEPEFAAGVVRAVGMLGGQAELDALQKFAPRKWLFGGASKSELANACAEAIHRLEGVVANEARV